VLSYAQDQFCEDHLHPAENGVGSEFDWSEADHGCLKEGSAALVHGTSGCFLSEGISRPWTGSNTVDCVTAQFVVKGMIAGGLACLGKVSHCFCIGWSGMSSPSDADSAPRFLLGLVREVSSMNRADKTQCPRPSSLSASGTTMGMPS